MSLLATTSKSALLTIAVSCITAGINLIKTDLYGGLALLIIGFALVVVFAFLVESQVTSKVEKLVLERLKLEGKGNTKSD